MTKAAQGRKGLFWLIALQSVMTEKTGGQKFEASDHILFTVGKETSEEYLGSTPFLLFIHVV